MAIENKAHELDVLTELLGQPESIAQGGFDLLRQLCLLSNAGNAGNADFPVAVQELLIRAREHRDAFGVHAPILDGLLRERGLFPYLDRERLSIRDQFAMELHRPIEDDGAAVFDSTVFHRAQARVYHQLLEGQNVALSAPTSFGKSLIIDAVIARGEHDHIAIVVPTIALIDETRRRLAQKFGSKFKIVTQAGQAAAAKTLFVLTPERVPQVEGLDKVTFFAIDEFYKLDPKLDPERSEALNEALYRLRATGAQFYLLGPNVKEMPREFVDGYKCIFERTDYATVATELRRVSATDDQKPRVLVELVADCVRKGEQTLVYCGSPESASVVSRLLAEHREGTIPTSLAQAADWAGDAYHPDWSFVRGFKAGVGLHHGRMPRALQQLVTRTFNSGQLDTLVCTSTLIEGVNTAAKNVIVFDHSIGGRALDYFTFHNIKGRSGRMMRHFVGRVFLFSDPPVGGNLEIDVPVSTQGGNAADSLLIQLEHDDLSGPARERVSRFYDQEVLPLAVLRANHGIEPEAQLELAEHLRLEASRLHQYLDWNGPYPTAQAIRTIAELIWTFFIGGRRPHRGALSAEQLAFFVNRYLALRDVKLVIDAELENQIERDGESKPDMAVEKSLEFIRNWAGYHFPRYLMAISRIQQVVFPDLSLPAGDYSRLASELENSFLPPGIAALDEYGVPHQVGRRLIPLIDSAEDLDGALAGLRRLNQSRLRQAVPAFSAFELSLIEEARSSL